jgi:hypothetical protein
MDNETDLQLLARGVEKALTGTGRFTREDFGRLERIIGGKRPSDGGDALKPPDERFPAQAVDAPDQRDRGPL